MNTFVLAEFLIESSCVGTYIDAIRKLDPYHTTTPCLYNNVSYLRITCGMEGEVAAMLKLTNEFLSSRMRISYIPDTLKNKYRA